jgi:hypothetical protein
VSFLYFVYTHILYLLLVSLRNVYLFVHSLKRPTFVNSCREQWAQANPARFAVRSVIAVFCQHQQRER